VLAAALLHHRNGLPNLAAGLEVAQKNDRIRQVAGIYRRVHLRADQPLVRPDHDRCHAHLAQIHQQLVQLNGQKALFGCRVQISIQAVDDDDLGVSGFNGMPDRVGELSGRQFGRIDLLQEDGAGLDVLAEIHLERVAAREKGIDVLVEQILRDVLAAGGRGRCELAGERGLACAGGADDQRARSFLDAAAQQQIERHDIAAEFFARCRLSVFSGDETGKDLEATLPDHVVVIATAKLDAAILHDPQAAALGPILWIQLLEQHDAMRDALNLQVAIGGCQVVEQQDRTLARREELFERENLPTIAEGTAGKQPEFRQRVEHDAGRFQSLHVSEDRAGRRRQFELGRVEHRVLLIGIERPFRRRQLANPDAVEHPAVRLGDGPQLVFRFRECHVEDRLSFTSRSHQVLERQGGLPRPRNAFDEKQATAREAAGHDVIEPGYPGRRD